MEWLFLFMFICLTFAPILIAWAGGDRILDGLSRRWRIRRRIRRRRATRSLPIRTEAMNMLLHAEEVGDRTEEQISRSLLRFRNLPDLRTHAADRDEVLQNTAQLLLTRESRFNSYLDLAWLQSETIEVLTQELNALRQLAGIGKDTMKSAGAVPSTASDPSQQLLRNLQAAANRRAALDRKLRNIGPAGDHGTRFDATIG